MLRVWAPTAWSVPDGSRGRERWQRTPTWNHRHSQGWRCRGSKPHQASPEGDLSPMAPSPPSVAARHSDPREAFGRAGELWGARAGSRETAERFDLPVVAGPARLVAWIFVAYKRWISPLLPPACRFTPSCSEYARLVVLKHGVTGGSWRAAVRIFKCQPFHRGGIDLP